MLKSLESVTTLFCLVSCFASCFASCTASCSASEAKAKGTLVYCSESSPAVLSPVLAADLPSLDVARHIYSTLIKADPDGGAPRPGLAESWTLSKDNLKYTFKLRKNVQFHSNDIFKPTRSMDASDIIFSIERQWKEDNAYHKIGSGFPLFSSLAFGSDIKAVRALDPLTVELELVAPLAGVLDRIANVSMGAVYSKEYADQLLASKTPQLIDTKPIGTGDFVFQSYEPNSKLVLKANNNYFAGPPKIDKLIFSIVPEANVRLQKLLTNECQVIFQADPSEIPRLRKMPELRITESKGNNVGFLIINTEKKPFDDVRVRRAILYAMNRKVYAEILHQGLGEVSESPLPQVSWSYEAVVPSGEYNPARARKLLKEAGVEKLQVQLWAMPIARAYNPNGRKLAELMQSDLAKVGIEASIEVYDWSSFLTKSKQGNHELLQMGWNGISPDPDFYLYTLLSCDAVKSGNNRSRWCDPKFDEVVLKARHLLDEKKRRPLYHEALKIFAQELPWIPVSSGLVYHIMRRQVKGVKAHADAAMYFHDAELVSD